MALTTLGTLADPDGQFPQARLLLLAAYLSLEGPTPRRFLAELFWPAAADPLNSLSGALRKLRPAGLVEADGTQVWSLVDTDAAQFRERLRAGDLDAAVALCHGEFARGLNTEDLGAELEEWVNATRETLAEELRGALLSLAERAAAAGHFEQAARQAEAAYRAPGARPVEPAQLPLMARLLRAADHPLSDEVSREAVAFGVPVAASRDVARGALRRAFLGRTRERELLESLPAGHWGWVRGGPGSGKTSLLRALAERGWQLLPARSGLPFATLEPLLGPMTGGEGAVVRRLTSLEQDLAIDDWAAVDPDSQRALVGLRRLRSAARVVISGDQHAPLPIDREVVLGPLSVEDLSDLPGAWDATSGVPALVGAWLQGQPLTAAMDARLAPLSVQDRTLFAALTLLDPPDVALVRTALTLSPADLTVGLERLLTAGLIEPSGTVRGRPAALAHLAGTPALDGPVALILARHLSGAVALPLYRRARAVWTEGDLPQVRRAYEAWAAALLQRGFAARAADILTEAPPGPETLLLRARALERAGRNLEVLELIGDSADPELNVLKAAVLFRLGDPASAGALLDGLTVTSLEGQAERHTTLGKLALAAGRFADAERDFRRAANKWLATGNKERWVVDVTNQAVARSFAGEHEDAAFQQALDAAGSSPWNRALVLHNMANGLSRKHRDQDALTLGQQAVDLALEAGAMEVAAAALYNLATYHEHLHDPVAARSAYQRCLDVAGPLNDHRLVGVALVGLSVLDSDPDAGREGIERLRQGGFMAVAEHIERALLEFRASSGEGV